MNNDCEKCTGNGEIVSVTIVPIKDFQGITYDEISRKIWTEIQQNRLRYGRDPKYIVLHTKLVKYIESYLMVQTSMFTNSMRIAERHIFGTKIIRSNDIGAKQIIVIM